MRPAVSRICPDGFLRSVVRTRCRTTPLGVTLACVGHVGRGSDFALIVADTAYTLETSNDDLRAELEKFGWHDGHDHR